MKQSKKLVRSKLASRKNRAKNLWTKYKISIEDYETILKKQDKKCAICGAAKKRKNLKSFFLCVDHDHRSGKVRGILCNKCNTALAFFNDSVDNLQTAASYLMFSELKIKHLLESHLTSIQT